MKRIITLQDISCVGKCSLTVSLPVISAMGIEACPLPTALLSNHTAFKSYKAFDLTEQMDAITDEFKAQGFDFDGIYSAYLGSIAQVDRVIDFIDEFSRGDTVILVDPVMGDHGKLYSGFNGDFPKKMLELVKRAQIIVPNVTEAGFLLGNNGALEYKNEADILAAMKRLSALGPETVVITGIETDGRSGAAIYNKATGEFRLYQRDKIDRTFHGTGDLFASVLFSCLIKGKTPSESLNSAVDITYSAMLKTVANKDARWYGVDFEAIMPELVSVANDFT